jgi:tetratricopeptide (TPR) repeat protein
MAIGQPDQAAHYRQLADDSRTGYSFFFEARQRVQNVGGMDAGVAAEVIPILEQAMKRGFSNNLQDEVNAYALLVAAHDAMQATEKANHYRSQQLTSLEAWIAKGIPTESDRCAKAYGQAAEICERLGRLENAAAFRQLQDENRDGSSRLTEALAELKTCGKHIEKEVGAKILDKLTKAAQGIPEALSERHAEIYRATGRILDAWGDTKQAIEYYQYALEKNPKIAVKGRLDVLRRRASKEAADGGSRRGV